jgi:hypothetical protein
MAAYVFDTGSLTPSGLATAGKWCFHNHKDTFCSFWPLQEHPDVQRMVKLLDAMAHPTQNRDNLAMLTLMSSCNCPITWCLFAKHYLCDSGSSTARRPTLSIMQKEAAMQMLVKLKGADDTQHFPDGKVPLRQMARQLLFVRSEQPPPTAAMCASLRVQQELWAKVDRALPRVGAALCRTTDADSTKCIALLETKGFGSVWHMILTASRGAVSRLLAASECRCASLC